MSITSNQKKIKKKQPYSRPSSPDYRSPFLDDPLQYWEIVPTLPPTPPSSPAEDRNIIYRINEQSNVVRPTPRYPIFSQLNSTRSVWKTSPKIIRPVPLRPQRVFYPTGMAALYERPLASGQEQEPMELQNLTLHRPVAIHGSLSMDHQQDNQYY